MEVFSFEYEGGSVGFLVTPKEKTILGKQQQQKTAKELVDLAEVMEVIKVAPNTLVIKGDTVVFSNLPK